MTEYHVSYYNWERDYTAPPWFSRLTCTDDIMSVVYTSPTTLEEDA